MHTRMQKGYTRHTHTHRHQHISTFNPLNVWQCACLCLSSLCIEWAELCDVRFGWKRNIYVPNASNEEQNRAHDTFWCACASLPKATMVGEAAVKAKQKQQHTKQQNSIHKSSQGAENGRTLFYFRAKESNPNPVAVPTSTTMKGMKKTHTNTLSTIVYERVLYPSIPNTYVCVRLLFHFFGCVAFNFKAESVHALNALDVIYVYIMYVFLYTHTRTHFRSCAYNNAGTHIILGGTHTTHILHMYGR